MISKEAAFSKISDLVDRFSEQYESYRKSEYNEAQQIKSRIDFCEEEINRAVYKLYDLTEEEIAIIEK